MAFTLYNKHLADLRRVCPDSDDVFVCPICFKVVQRQHIRKETSIGHVWSKYIRKQGENTNQTVLLCQKCNSKAGELGDSSMQEHLKARHGARKTKVSMYIKRMEKPLVIHFDNFDVSDHEKKVDIGIQIPRNAYKYNEVIKRFSELGHSGQVIDHIIAEPYDGIDIDLVKVGWLTAAYLFAFYTFGYRYVFQSAVDPVRQYIQGSFDSNVDNRLTFNNSKDMCTRIINTHSEKPQIQYEVCKVDNVLLDYITVNLLEFSVRLPIKLKSLPSLQFDKLIVPELAYAMPLTGHSPHEDCIWNNALEIKHKIVGSEIITL